MEFLGKLIRNRREQTRSKNYVFLYLLFVIIVICSAVSKTAYAQNQVTYPFFLLDINANDNEAQTEPGFTSFTVNDSGSEIDGITVEIAALTGSIGARLRGAPTGIPYELIYRDFIFSRPGGMRITLSGLESNETYQITIYAYDNMSSAGGDRIADWTANGEFCLTTAFLGGNDPTGADDYAFSGMAQSDDNGTIVLEAGPNENTTEESGANNPYAFVNALVISSMTPVNIARRPVPEDGAIITTNEITLQWAPGNTSVSSNVYVGESFTDVNEATTGDTDIFRGNSVEVSFPIGSAGNPYPDGLTEGKTYYWRIDEVEDNGTANKGNVWSFTVAPKTAFIPIPVDGSLFIDPNITLQWTPGAGAIDEHHVYFGDNLQDVQAGTGGTDKGTVTDPNYTTGLLESNKIYYWRIDESDGTNTYTGDVWSFTTSLPGMGTITMDLWEDVEGDHTLVNLLDDPRYPDSPTSTQALTELGTVDGVGDGYGAQIYGWLYCPITGDYTFFLSCAGQGELWLSTNDDPTNIVLLASETTWGSYNTFTIKSVPISLVAGEKYYIMARWKDFGSWDHCQVAWQGPGVPSQQIIQGNYLSPYLPVNAYGASPANGATDIDLMQDIIWKSGTYTSQHQVFFGTDPNAVRDADTSSPEYKGSQPRGTESFNPGILDPNTTYYWRINEVNDANPDSPWIGNVWSFTTGDYVIVDDFESYNDINEGEEGSNRIYMVWSDGYNNPTINGGTIGYPDPDFANGESFVETNIVRGGSQSGPLLYSTTTASYAEVSLSTSQMAIGSDWTQKGIDTLSIWFHGDPNNAGTEQLYVKLNNSKLLISGVDLTLAVWQNAYISLADFGINLTNVTQLTIGLDKNGVGSEGILFMDDIRLYNSSYGTAPVPKIIYVDATEAGNTMLATGEVFTTTESDSGSDNLWRGRVFANNGTVFESGGQYGDTVNTEDCPRLVTSVPVPEGNYEVYVYFWDDGSGWRIQASLSNDDLSLFIANDPNGGATSAVAEDFEEPEPMLIEGNRTLWQAYLGTTGNTSNITAYIDDEAAHMTGNARTWYDGIGYKAVLPEN